MKRIWMTGIALSVLAAACPAAAQQTLRIGSEVDGRLESGDGRLGSGEFVDAYEFQGRAGQTITVDLNSSAFDPYLMIRGPAGFSQDNDDRAGSDAGSTISARLPADGTYRISATSYRPKETGGYRLVLRGGGGTTTQAGGGAAATGVNAGRLDKADETLDSGEFVDRWTFRGEPGRRYVARLSATDFDAYLFVRGDDLSEDNDDDPSTRGGRDSRLEFVMPADGVATLSATSYQSGEVGAYTLTLEAADGATVRAEAPAERDSAGGLAVGQTVRGRLGQGDPTLTSGEYMQSWTLSGRAGDRVDLDLNSGDFDAYLLMLGPQEFRASNDDGDGTDSRLTVTLPSDGDYQVIATTYQPGESGAYSLSARRASAGAPDTATPSFEAGVELTGSLGAGDVQLDTGEFSDVYRFTGRRGERIAVTAASEDFDTYLILSGPGDAREDNDDGVEGGTDSRIDMVLPADGEYRVQVTSYQPGESGAYRFTAGPSLGAPRQAGVEGGPRVFAVMVGVSDYAGTADNLAYTAEDAEKLAEALRREGVLNPESIVLTDARATVAGVRAAFDRAAREAGPNDLFLFFFSGHGMQRDGTVSALEPDGRVETIALQDGEISDAEMAEMFGRLHTRMSMIVLDSCFSGGFARNVVSRPDTLGLFSSEEDLTSSVAAKFEAGGFLAHFLREGLTGAANLDGDDLITAGELSTYLRRTFTQEVQNVDATTLDGQHSYQNLVVDRGGVQVDDVVLRLAAR